jgi:hypothetical protein
MCEYLWLRFLFHPMFIQQMVVWLCGQEVKILQPNVEMGGRESRQAYLMGTTFLVEQYSPNVLASTTCESPNVEMGERDSR